LTPRHKESVEGFTSHWHHVKSINTHERTKPS
jgi:hypothetical protein